MKALTKYIPALIGMLLGIGAASLAHAQQFQSYEVALSPHDKFAMNDDGSLNTGYRIKIMKCAGKDVGILYQLFTNGNPGSKFINACEFSRAEYLSDCTSDRSAEATACYNKALTYFKLTGRYSPRTTSSPEISLERRAPLRAAGPKLDSPAHVAGGPKLDVAPGPRLDPAPSRAAQ